VEFNGFVRLVFNDALRRGLLLFYRDMKVRTGPRAYAPDALQPLSCATLVLSSCFRRSHFRRQSVSSYVLPERPLAAKGWNCVGENHGR
jgi:hypothetical protein